MFSGFTLSPIHVQISYLSCDFFGNKTNILDLQPILSSCEVDYINILLTNKRTSYASKEHYTGHHDS